jgi:lipid A 4'-phosphatase
MKKCMAVGCCLAVFLLLCVAFPIDLWFAEFFFSNNPKQHFFMWRLNPLTVFIHEMIVPMALGLGGLLLGATLWAAYKKRGWRRWLFVLLALIIGPGIVTNVILKDHWGRARPHQIEQFRGDKQYSPPFVIARQCPENCSFVSGDASFGFWLHCFAYIAPRRRKQLFWGGLAVGTGLGVMRMGMGAHFLSDVLCAGLITMAVAAILYRVMFGAKALGIMWREFCPADKKLIARPQPLG